MKEPIPSKAFLGSAIGMTTDFGSYMAMDMSCHRKDPLAPPDPLTPEARTVVKRIAKANVEARK